MRATVCVITKCYLIHQVIWIIINNTCEQSKFRYITKFFFVFLCQWSITCHVILPCDMNHSSINKCYNVCIFLIQNEYTIPRHVTVTLQSLLCYLYVKNIEQRNTLSTTIMFSISIINFKSTRQIYLRIDLQWIFHLH